MTANSVVFVNDADLQELDLHSADFADYPRDFLAAALARGPIARSKRGVEFLSYALIGESFLNDDLDTAGPEHYRNLGAGAHLLKFVDSGLLSTMERSRHDPIRRLMLRAFSFKNVAQQRALVRATVEEMVGEWASAGQCDLVADLTENYPIRVMCKMIGIPSEDVSAFAHDAHELHLLAAVPMAPGFPRIERSLANLESYVEKLLEARRRSPKDDFVSALLASQETEGRLSADELVGNLVNLIFAGMGTTTKQLASAVSDLVGAKRWDLLHEDESRVGPIVDECLRYSPVTQFVVRIAQRDTEIAGFLFPQGTRIIFNLLAASRDPDKFADPEQFDITRPNDDSRLPFGWGVHRCLGQPLARMLIEEGLIALSQTIRDVRIESRDRGPHPAEMLGGPSQLDITFTRR